MTDAAALMGAILSNPGDDLPRLAYADWLDDHGDPERAAVLRLRRDRTGADGPARRSAEAAAWLACAAAIESRDGLAGLADFSRLQNWASDLSGIRTPADQAAIDREYDTLLRNWRRWLPPSVTTLTARADREVYNADYYSPAVTFPTRRRDRFSRTPRMAVLFFRGLPLWARCDDDDWRRCGRDMIHLYPWVEWSSDRVF